MIYIKLVLGEKFLKEPGQTNRLRHERIMNQQTTIKPQKAAGEIATSGMSADKFRLIRYFSITSLALMVLATFVIGTLHRVFEKNDLLQLGESHSIALTQTFVNTIWPKFRGYTDTASQLDIDALRHS